MITVSPAFYHRFRCLGGSCPLTCCRDWAIVLDEDALADYACAPQPLRATLTASLMEDDDGDICFRLREDGLCALLDPDGLCTIQRRWGEEHLCTHCGAYPRFLEEYGCLTECCQAISCPEAARLLAEDGLFPLARQDDGVADAPFPGVDKALLDGLLASRSAAFRLLEQQNTPLWSRLSALLSFSAALQSALDGGFPLEAPLPSPAAAAAPADALRAMAVRVLRLLASLDPLRTEWPALLSQSAQQLQAMPPEDYAALTARYQAQTPMWSVHLTRLAEYFVFRHWPKVVNDDMLYGRVALACACCLALFHLDLLAFPASPEDPWRRSLLWAALSREVEHLDENFFALAETLSHTSLWPLADAMAPAASQR